MIAGRAMDGPPTGLFWSFAGANPLNCFSLLSISLLECQLNFDTEYVCLGS